MKVALVYDRLNKWGGAERVLLALHKLFPDAPLYTSVYDPINAPWAKVFKIQTSFLQNFPLITRHELYASVMPLAFESFNFDEFDLVISVTSEAAKGIITKPGVKHICYCLTPTRYLWSGYDEYFKNPILRFASMPIVSYLKTWDKIAAQRPDAYISISKEVQRRITKYYNRDSEVIYPPLGLNPKSEIRNPKQYQNTNSKIQNYFLVVSRLVFYKRIDLAVKAFNKLKLPLKIIGTGSELERLKSMANSNVEFLGYLTDKELVRYYSGCKALVFPGIEDFGLTILEAQSFGRPVIAFRKGGALETIIEGETGLFFNDQSTESLIKAINQFNNPPGGEAGITIDAVACIHQAEKFNFETFKKKFMEEILRLMPQDDMEKKI